MSKASVQRVRRLGRHARARREEGAFVVEGPRAISAALDHGADLDEVLVVGGAEAELVNRARAAGAEITYVDGEQLERALTTRTPQPIVAVAPILVATSSDVAERARETGLPVVVLAGVGDPGNAGTVIRSAAAAGAAGVLLTPGSVDPMNPKCVRASAGSIFALPVAPVESLSALGLTNVGAAAGGLSPEEVDLSGPVALVLGGEAAGLPEDELVDDEVALPLEAGVESLNVAMAATVLLYEARRQRQGGAW
jgi:TrmH family RNA methyltransferase